MRNLKVFAGMFLTAGLLFSCSNEENALVDDGTVDNPSAITIDLLLGTSEGTSGTSDAISTRGKDDVVPGVGTPKGKYPLDYLYLVQANHNIPAEKIEHSQVMDLKKNGARVSLWVDGDYVKIQPANDKTAQVLEFKFSEIGSDGYPTDGGIGGTFFYSSIGESVLSLPTLYPAKDGEKPTSTEFGDELFTSPQYVFVRGTDSENPVRIYQVYPQTELVYPKEENTLWPVQMNRNAAAVNLKFMFVDVDDNNPYGVGVEEVKSNWETLFGGSVDLNGIYIDGAKIMGCPSTFDVCSLTTIIGRQGVYTNLLLFDGKEDGGDISEMQYVRVTGEKPATTEGVGFATKEYPFIFPVLGFDGTSRVQVNVCVPELNARLKCSVPFSASDQIAFKANTTTFLWVMLDIDMFKEIYDEAKAKLDAVAPASLTRSGGMKEIEVELPADCLKIGEN